MASVFSIGIISRAPAGFLGIGMPRIASFVARIPAYTPSLGVPSLGAPFVAPPSLIPGLFRGWLGKEPVQDTQSREVDAMPTPYDENGLVLAAPKKKVSYRRRRQRQLAGSKHVQEVKNLVRCPACGHIKRSHTLCMHCVKEIQKVWKKRDAPGLKEGHYSEEHMDPVDLRLLYPGRRETKYQEELKQRHKYLYSRPPTLVKDKTMTSEERYRQSALASAARVGPKPLAMIYKKPRRN